MSKKISFVTFGDANYFLFIEINVRSINRLYPNSKIFICNFGFENKQIEKLKKIKNVQIINWNEKDILKTYFHNSNRAFFDFLFKLKKYKLLRILLNRLFINKGTERIIFKYFSVSKSLILFKVVNRLNNDYLVFLDGDAILLDKIDEVFDNDFEIGVTSKLVDKKTHDFHSINGGVMFFKCDDKRKIIFLSEWVGMTLIDELNKPNSPHNYPDQMSLNKMVFNYYPNKNNFKFMQFEKDIYNWTKPERGIKGKKIIHYKGRGIRKEEKPYIKQLQEMFEIKK